MADEGTNNASGSVGSGKNPLVAILLITNAVALGAVAFLQYKTHLRESEKPSIHDVVKAQMKELNPEVGEHGETEEGVKKEEKDGNLLPLAGFTANLAHGDGPRRYVRLDAVLKFSKESKEEEFKTRQPQIRDVIISILNSKRPEDLLKIEGKSYLKEEIKAAINSFLIDGQVEDVYYVGFQIN